MDNKRGSGDPDRSDDRCETILLQPYNYILQKPGKQIRGKLAQAFNIWMKIPEDKLQIISCVMDMLHNASLLIDDIEDNSSLRRGIPVAHHIYGIGSTINSANYVYFLALQKILNLGHPDACAIFTEQLIELHKGQGMEIYWRDSYHCPTEEEYRSMVIQKTGGLFMLAVRLMQLFSSCTVDFRPLTETLGLIFQVRDDYCNLMDADYSNNKSYCEDLTEGKFSFPIIHGVKHDPSRRVIGILRQRTEDVSIKKYCVDYLIELGSMEYTRKYLFELDNCACETINKLGGNSALIQFLSELRRVYTLTSE